MGKHQKAEVEQIRALIAAGAHALQVTEVAAAADNLREVLSQHFPDPSTQVAAISTLAGLAGASATSTGCEHQALNAQLSIISSVYATHQFNNRTLH